jgi:hypothetical protein
MDAMHEFRKTTVALFCAVMLLVPVGILVLAPISMVGSFVVVLGFCLLLVILLRVLEVEFTPMLLGVSAYVAVLASLLSNLNQGRCS